MRHIFTAAPLLTLCTLTSFGQQTGQMELAASVGGSTTSAIHYGEYATFGGKPILSPTGTFWIGKRFSKKYSFGGRVEVAIWRSKDDQSNYTDINAQPIDPQVFTVYSAGYPVVTVAPFVRRHWGQRRFRGFAGVFAGYAHAFCDTQFYRYSVQGKEKYLEEQNLGNGNGFVTGFEIGESARLNSKYSLLLTVAGQYAWLKSSQHHDVTIQLFAFPFTIGVVRYF